MIETVLRDHLTSELSLPVLLEESAEHETYVLIERTGGGEEEHISRATFAIQSWADSMYHAAELNERVKRAMISLAENPMIGKIMLNTDYNFTDTTKKKYRYQAVYDLIFYDDEEVNDV